MLVKMFYSLLKPWWTGGHVKRKTGLMSFECLLRQDNARSRTQALQCICVRVSNVDT